jgi:hypothetical protein
MKKKCFYGSLLAAVLCIGHLGAQDDTAFPKEFNVVSNFHSVPGKDKNDLQNLVYYRFAWRKKAPYAVAIQFVNLGYGERKLKFAVKDITSKKNVVIDPAHQSCFGTEALKESSKGMIWSGPIDSPNDRLSLRVWEDGGDEIDKAPISMNDKK